MVFREYWNIFFYSYILQLIPSYWLVKLIKDSLGVKNNKLGAKIITFMCINLTPIYDAFGHSFIGNGYVRETKFICMVNRLVNILWLVCFLLYIQKVIRERWHHYLWFTVLVYYLLLIPIFLYLIFDPFQKVAKNQLPMPIQALPNYVCVLLILYLWGWIIHFFMRSVFYNTNIKRVSKWAWVIIYSLLGALFITTDKRYTIDNSKFFLRPSLLNIIKSQFKMLLCFIFVLLFIVIILKVYEYKVLKRENKFLSEKLQLQYQYYLDMQQQEENLGKMYHDLGNYIRTIQILIKRNEYEEALAYTNQWADQVHDISINKFCNNRIIDAVLVEKARVCKEHNISFEVDIRLPEKLKIQEIDLMSLYANLLDNAIEACCSNENVQNYIQVTTNIISQYLAVKVVNSKSIMTKKKVKLGDKWKSTYQLSGLGLKIVNDVVKRYQGEKKFVDTKEQYSALIMLKLN